MEKQINLIRVWMHEKRLVRLVYVEQKLGHRAIYGRIIKLDEQAKILLLYNDDEKKVYSFNFSEIDNIEPSSSTIHT